MSAKNLKLRFLCLIHRHGERAPFKFLPNDPNTRHFPYGACNLTKSGQMDMYKLGRILRKRYDDFLGGKPFSRDVYVRSTDTDRCLVSAQCCLAGLYPPVDDDDKLSPNINFQPVPVHTVTDATDPLAIRFPAKYRHPESGIYEDPAYNELYKTMMKHQELLDLVDQIFNLKGHLRNISTIIDTILVEARNKLPIPKQLEGRVEDLKELFFAVIQLHCAKHIEGRLAASILLEEIVNHMEKIVAVDSTSHRTFIYSLHDLNIISLVAALTNEIMRCPTASCLVFELHEDIDISGQFYVKIHFLQEHDRDPLELKLRGRGLASHGLVHFTEFKTFVRNYHVKTTQQNDQVANTEPFIEI